MRKIAVFVLMFLFFISISTVKADEQSCVDQVKKAVKQIKGVDPTNAAEATPQGNKNGVKIDDIFLYCAYEIQHGGGDQVRQYAGITYPKDGGGYLIGIDQKDVDDNLGLIKMLVYHELEHARLYAGDNIGYKDPLTGATLGPIFSGGRFTDGKSEWYTRILPCHEAIAHAHSLIYAQSISDEFSDLTKSKEFWHSLDLFEKNLDICMKIEFKGKWNNTGTNLKNELVKLKDKIIEKKLLQANKDSKISQADLKQIDRIRKWLGMTSTEFEEIYRKFALGCIEKRIGDFTGYAAVPPAIGDLLRDEGISLVVRSENMGGKALLVKGVEIRNGMLSLKEQPEPTLTIKIDETVFNGIANSLAPDYAAQMAIRDGEVGIEKGLITNFINFGQRILVKAPAPKQTINYEGENAVVKTNAKGVHFLEIGGKKDVIMLNKYLAPVGYSTSGAQRLMAYMPEQLSKNAGVYAEDSNQLMVGEI